MGSHVCAHTHTHTHTLSLSLASLNTLLILSGLENRRIEYRAYIYRYVEIIKYLLEIISDQIRDFEKSYLRFERFQNGIILP